MIRKSLRSSSFIFGDPRVSLYVSSLTADHYFWCSRVFLAVLRVFRGIMGCSVVFRGCSGVCSGCVPGVFRGVPGVFRGVPGFTDTRFRRYGSCLQLLYATCSRHVHACLQHESCCPNQTYNIFTRTTVAH